MYTYTKSYIYTYLSVYAYLLNTSWINMATFYQIFHNVQMTISSSHMNQFPYILGAQMYT